MFTFWLLIFKDCDLHMLSFFNNAEIPYAVCSVLLSFTTQFRGTFFSNFLRYWALEVSFWNCACRKCFLLFSHIWLIVRLSISFYIGNNLTNYKMLLHCLLLPYFSFSFRKLKLSSDFSQCAYFLHYFSRCWYSSTFIHWLNFGGYIQFENPCTLTLSRF